LMLVTALVILLKWSFQTLPQHVEVDHELPV